MFNDGRVALVTGAGGGIGREIALEFAKNGVKVTLLDMMEDRLQETEKLIAEVNGECLVIPSDITSKDECFNAVEKTIAKWGRLDILVNCAGILIDNTIKKITTENWEKVQSVNLKGPLFLTQAVYDLMKNQKYGRIINIASPAYLGSAGQGAYSASKGGLVSLTKTTCAELAKHGITANVVCPGLVATNITANMPQEVFDKIEQGLPMKRLCKPSDVAHAVKFFASDAAGYISGQVLMVIGGAL